MIGLQVHLDGDNCWPDLRDREFVDAELVAVAGLANGTVEGNPAVLFRVELPDGTVAIAQTTLKLLLTAAEAFAERHGDPR